MASEKEITEMRYPAPVQRIIVTENVLKVAGKALICSSSQGFTVNASPPQARLFYEHFA